MRRQRLALGRHPRPDEPRTDSSADQMRLLSHVAHTEHETQFAVPLADHGVSAEYKRLATLLGPGHLGKHDAHHERLQS